MSNPSKRKGTSFETDVVDYLRSHGFPFAERRALRGSKDCGDIAGVIGWVLECKAVNAMALGEWMTEAHKEAINDRSCRYAVIHKRRGRNVREAYVTVPLWLFCDEVGDGPTPAEEAS